MSGDSARTFFLGSQGYYTEWVRNGWLRAPRANRTFTPSDTALADAIQRWRVTQDTLEARFMATRVPVRWKTASCCHFWGSLRPVHWPDRAPPRQLPGRHPRKRAAHGPAERAILGRAASPVRDSTLLVLREGDAHVVEVPSGPFARVVPATRDAHR